MAPAKPTLDLLRSLSDEHVLRALMEEGRATRAALAARTGISKPTVSQSVSRLTEAGLLLDTGERTTGRGRAGSYYALADVGCALVVGIAPEGVVAETIDAHGVVLARAVREAGRPARPAEVAAALRGAAEEALRRAPSPARLAVVSAADPVDRTTGRLVHLPDAPFLLGELDPADTLAPLVAGPIVVDNDVNWAARAERRADPGDQPDDFAYLHLGEGLGCAVVSDGEVRRGHGGLAGEVAHLVTTGPGGQARAFTEVFEVLGLRQAGSTALDVPALLAAVGADCAVRDALARAVTGVLTALVALADPGHVVLGGSWGRSAAVLDAVTREFDRQPRHVAVRRAVLDHEPALAGARNHALAELRTGIVAEARGELTT